MRRVLVGILGAMLLLLGLAALVVGGLLLAAFGRDGTLSVDSGRLSGEGAAIVTENLLVNGGGSLQQRLGVISFAARSPDGKPLFVGLGRADDVFGYLDGVPYEVVSDVGSPGGTTSRPVPGRKAPAPPRSQGFWIAKAEGQAPEFTWPQTSASDQRLVLMNADGSARVTATLSVVFRSTTVFPLALGCLVGGLISTLLGMWLLVRSVRRRRSDPPAPPAFPPPSLPQPPPGATPPAPPGTIPLPPPGGAPLTPPG